ncbi:MAG: hypothetical protein M1815_004084 [Lichina confinis]|nr:MAG: hypothetical protein M1815_004084 [Lichina confinis]
MGKASKDKRDAYYRLAKEQGWRARSAFKLLQLNEEFNLFEGVTRVVDLCAAPGGWSQVLSRVLVQGETFDQATWALQGSQAETQHDETRRNTSHLSGSDAAHAAQSGGTRARDVKIVAIDLQPMTPLTGITTLAADITHPSTVPLLLQALDPDTFDPGATCASRPVDLVISDGAPDATGLHDFDMYVQSQLLFSALDLALCVLKPGGTFVAKVFRGKDVDLTYARLRGVFERVAVGKPRSSRASSIEAFVVCQGFSPPPPSIPSKGLDSPPSSWQPHQRMSVRPSARPGSPRPGRTNFRSTKTILENGIIELHFNNTGNGGDSGDSDAGDDGAEQNDEDGNRRWIPPFVACGHPASYDSDATYRLPKGTRSLDPVQPPTAPPYKRALEMRRAAGGAYGKTKR